MSLLIRCVAVHVVLPQNVFLHGAEQLHLSASLRARINPSKSHPVFKHSEIVPISTMLFKERRQMCMMTKHREVHISTVLSRVDHDLERLQGTMQISSGHLVLF